MKLRTSFLTRFLALALALVMIASSANLGLVARVFAATDSEITDGELVAKNYDLSAAEKALLESGLLMGDTHEYKIPADDDGLVTVDPEKKTVKASSFDNDSWKPVSAVLTASNGTEETIALNNGEGSFEYDGNAYTVAVKYEATINVDTTVQTTLLSTAGWLKQGVANIDTIANASGTLSAIELAMPELVNLVENGYTVAGKNFGFEVFVKDAVKALNAQMTANGGSLNLTVMLDEYKSAKVKYLLTKGMDFKAEVETTTAHIESINTALTTALNVLGGLSGSGLVDENAVDLVDRLNKMLTNWTTVAGPVIEADWTAAEKGTALVKSGITDAEYAKLNTLVAALGATSNVTVTETLKLDSATVKVSTSMADVTVVIKLSHYVNGVMTDAETFEKTVTLAQGVTKADVETEVNNVEQVAIQAYQTAGIDLDHFEAKIECSVKDWSEGLPEGNHTYTVTYAPKTYTITYDYQESEEIPYGAQITLERHADSNKAYDYKVNGVAYAQGSVITVEGDTAITRAEGKAYATNDLLSVIVNNGYGNEKTNAILSSGALYGNETIAVRYPDANKGKLADFAEGSDTVITTKTYDSDYNGLKWAAYKYIVDDGDTKYFDGKDATVGVFNSGVKVYFRLTLSNYGAATTQKWMDLAKTLETEAAAQKAALDALASNYDTMGQLDKIKLGALNGVIDVTDFTPGDGNENDAETLRLRGEFKAIVSSMISDHLDSNGQLKIYNMLGQYNKNGLVYYYTNYDAFKAEIDKLSGYLNGLLEEEEALQIMVSAAGYPEYAEKITGLGTTLDEAKAALSAPNPAIILSNEVKLAALVNALTMEGTAGTAKDVAAPYLDDNAPHTVEPKGYKGITVTVKIKDQDGLSVSKTWTIETVLTEDDIAELKADVDAKINELFANDNKAFYTGNYDGSELDALVGVAVADLNKVAYEYEWTLKSVSVTVPGMEGQTIDKNNATIKLAPSTDPSVRYDYYIDGVKVEGSTYTFTPEQLAAIFAGKAPKFERKEVNLGAETFEKFVKNLNDKIDRDDAAVYQNGTLTVNITTDELQGFVMGLVMDSGYSYIGLGGEGLVYLNEGGSLEISIQTLINAILNEKFSNATVIDLADGTGTLTTTTMELGNDKAGATAYPFVLKLSGIPAEIAPVAEILNLGYIKLNGTADHKLNIELNLPEKLYQAYLTALIATGKVDLKNVAAVNNEIAVNFLWDYANGIITNDEITTETYTNTLKKLGQNMDLTKYEDYYQKARTAIQKYLVVENGQADFHFVDDISLLKGVLDSMMSGSDMSTLLQMIKEYNGGLELSATVTVKGIINNYEALILDNGDSGVDKINYTKNLSAEKINGTAVVILLKDATADLTFPATAILDLNGFELTGNVKSNGNLIIIDSDMDTFNGGSVSGDVSGNVTVIGGTYSDDVTSYLKNGYVQENGTVSNALYTIATDAAGNITFNVNANVYREVSDDYTPFIEALAIDMGADLIMNYFTTAYLELGGNKIYGVALDDMIAILEGEGTDGKVDALIEDVLASVSAPGMSAFVNQIIADLLNFQKISENVGTNNPVATHTLVTAPWNVEINHIEDGNYLTVGIGYGEKTDSVNVNIAIVGDNAAVKEVKALTGALAEIVTKTDIAVNIEQPTYNPKTNTFDVTGTAKAIVEIDLTKNENYTTVLAVILANGTGKTSYVEALNAGDMAALKDAVDATTINDVFTSLKALSRDVNFAAMAEKVGAEVTTDAAGLEAVYHIYLTAAGAVLDRIDVSGGNRTLGSFDTDDDGVYVVDKDNDVVRTGDASARGYTVKYDLALTDLSFSVKVFGEIEPPVVETAAIDVLDEEGNIVATAENFFDALIALYEHSAAAMRFNKEVELDSGWAFSSGFAIINAHNLNMNGFYFYIGNTKAEITSDGALNVATQVDGYYVKSSVNAATNIITYSLAEIEAPTSEAPIAGSKGIKIDDINYLIVDLDPNGEEYADMVAALIFEKMEKLGYTATYSDGEGIVKNADQMTVTFVNADEVKVAQITYTVVVLGDVTGNGLVDSTDATKIQETHYRWLDATVAQLLAANICISEENSIQDVIDEDRTTNSVIINSTDATKIQEKHYFWDRGFTPYKSMLENYVE